jgi:hypothetical protein
VRDWFSFGSHPGSIAQGSSSHLPHRCRLIYSLSYQVIDLACFCVHILLCGSYGGSGLVSLCRYGLLNLGKRRRVNLSAHIGGISGTTVSIPFIQAIASAGNTREGKATGKQHLSGIVQEHRHMRIFAKIRQTQETGLLMRRKLCPAGASIHYLCAHATSGPEKKNWSTAAERASLGFCQ